MTKNAFESVTVSFDVDINQVNVKFFCRFWRKWPLRNNFLEEHFDIYFVTKYLSTEENEPWDYYAV